MASSVLFSLTQPNVEGQIQQVENDIRQVENDIKQTEIEIKTAIDNLLHTDKDHQYWQDEKFRLVKKEEQLRKKEEQLRKDKEQLREERMLLLQRVPPGKFYIIHT